MKYTLIGDSVNVASRLESLNKLYATYIMISGELHQVVSANFVCKMLDCVSVVGKGVSTMVYEVLIERTGELDNAEEQEMLKLEATSEDAFKAYQRRDWEVAKPLYKQMGGKHGDLFLERIAEFEKNPPPKCWCGMTVLLNK
jgi:adenylate cyclase